MRTSHVTDHLDALPGSSPVSVPAPTRYAQEGTR